MNPATIETKPATATHHIIAPASGARCYKLRAECADDMKRLLDLLPKTEIVETSAKEAASVGDSSELTLSLRTLSLDQVRDLCRKVQDGHVMLQTVQPEDQYTGERNFDLE